MDFLRFLLSLSLIFLFGYLFQTVLSMVLGLILIPFRVRLYSKTFTVFTVIVSIITNYLLISLVVILILFRAESTAAYLGYAVIGGLMIFWLNINALSNKTKNGTYKSELELNGTRHMIASDSVLSIAVIPAYILALVFPDLVISDVNEQLWGAFIYVQSIPVLGWLLRGIAALIFLKTVFSALFMGTLFSALAVGKLKGGSEWSNEPELEPEFKPEFRDSTVRTKAKEYNGMILRYRETPDIELFTKDFLTILGNPDDLDLAYEELEWVDIDIAGALAEDFDEGFSTWLLTGFNEEEMYEVDEP